MSRAGRALRAHRAVMSAPSTPRTLDDEERAGFEAGRSLVVPAEHFAAVLASYEADSKDADPIKAARARGLLRGLREPRAGS